MDEQPNDPQKLILTWKSFIQISLIITNGLEKANRINSLIKEGQKQ